MPGYQFRIEDLSIVIPDYVEVTDEQRELIRKFFELPAGVFVRVEVPPHNGGVFISQFNKELSQKLNEAIYEGSKSGNPAGIVSFAVNEPIPADDVLKWRDEVARYREQYLLPTHDELISEAESFRPSYKCTASQIEFSDPTLVCGNGCDRNCRVERPQARTDPEH